MFTYFPKSLFSDLSVLLTHDNYELVVFKLDTRTREDGDKGDSVVVVGE